MPPNLQVFPRVSSVRSWFLVVSLYDSLLQLTQLPHTSQQWLLENGFATEFMTET